ncbi:MAG: hypothetical protein LBR41_02975 [Rickettsiales bacterium]|jgi:hypothetical protein|nr:hypothetical protein [Rickettsiales bacterium]
MTSKSLYALGALFMLTACGGGGSKYAFDNEKFNDGDYSFVVMSASNNIKTGLVPDNSFRFKNEKGDEFSIYLNGTNGFMIPSGNYELDYYGIYKYRQNGNFVQTINSNFTEFAEASFSVKPGHAYYLGKNELNITRAQKNPKSNIFFRKTPQGEHMDFTAVMVDDFDKLPQSVLEKYETQTGKKLEKNIMKWKDIDHKAADVNADGPLANKK